MKKPAFKITYESKDITKDIKPYVLSIDYTDNHHGQSDEVVIQLEDSDKLWQSSWYPSKGDKIEVSLGYEGENLLKCGSFEIDEIDYSAPPDVFTIKGLATNIKKALRQENSIAYENKTLKQIAQEVAQRHDLELVGEIQEVKIQRITQDKERDLTFLKNLAEQYGYIFKVTEDQLVFYEINALKAANPVMILSKKDFSQINMSEKTLEKYKACEVSYHNPKLKGKITITVQDENITTGNVLKLNSRCETKEQAILQARAALEKKNSCLIEGSLSLMGEPNLVTSLNIELKELGNFSGKYHIKRTKHKLDKNSGLSTSLEVERA